MQNGLFLKNLWYFALPGDKLKKGRLQAKELLGERVVLGRDSSGNPVALRDNCPHRGVPLSEGKFDVRSIACFYHGWHIYCLATYHTIPHLPNDPLHLQNTK